MNVCMGDMALMPKICEKLPILADFLMIFWALWSPGGTPYPSPGTLWMIILSMEHSINHVCTNEKFDSMYGWYGSNAQNMWKIAFFSYFWWFLGSLEPGYDPIFYSRCPMNDYFIFGTFHNVCTNETFDSMYG